MLEILGFFFFLHLFNLKIKKIVIIFAKYVFSQKLLGVYTREEVGGLQCRLKHGCFSKKLAGRNWFRTVPWGVTTMIPWKQASVGKKKYLKLERRYTLYWFSSCPWKGLWICRALPPLVNLMSLPLPQTMFRDFLHFQPNTSSGILPKYGTDLFVHLQTKHQIKLAWGGSSSIFGVQWPLGMKMYCFPSPEAMILRGDEELHWWRTVSCARLPRVESQFYHPLALWTWASP